MTTSPKPTKDQALKLALNELEELTSVAAQCDSWQSFPYEPLEKAYATITAIREALAQPAAAAMLEAQPAHSIPGLGRMTDDDDGFVTLQFKDEDAAEAFMQNYAPSVEVDEMPEIQPAADDKAGGEVVAWSHYKEVVDALSNLLGQVELFCNQYGEADFETGEALRAMESVCEYEAKSTPPAGVPDEATPAMLEAYGRVLAMGSELDGAMVWRAMLSAAPQPAAQTQEVPQPELRCHQ